MVSSLKSANVIYNATDSVLGGGGTTGPWTYCNATVYYTHTGSDDSVFISYALPALSAFENRFYVQG
ncbi:putative tannase subunit protein [Botrytis cinerea BcDW1]|uniref:Putative tannase subunit protein n=1 Tax=Botryotinia fuckeliana (strain BcDW1) TaxID=1290391 RepID=M7UAU0_BOTF1|nr:putative tannase subunit protein [Botrytis cinerea BcDW1]